MDIIHAYFEILLRCFQFDMMVFTTPAMYYWVIPIIFYIHFFILKWVILTIPIWISFVIVISFIYNYKIAKEYKLLDKSYQYEQYKKALEKIKKKCSKNSQDVS